MRQLSTMLRVRRGALVAVLALVGASVLTGCRSEPGIAAYVGHEKITVDRVDAILDAVDKVNMQRTTENDPPPIPTGRQVVLSLIVYGELAGQLITDKDRKLDYTNVDTVAVQYSIPVNHPYAQLLGTYLDELTVLSARAGSTQPPDETVLRYRNALAAAQVPVRNDLSPAEVAVLNVQPMLDDAAKKQNTTINPLYGSLPMPVFFSSPVGPFPIGIPFEQTGDPFVTDYSGATG